VISKNYSPLLKVTSISGGNKRIVTLRSKLRNVNINLYLN
jgi:hypothetical protein